MLYVFRECGGKVLSLSRLYIVIWFFLIYLDTPLFKIENATAMYFKTHQALNIFIYVNDTLNKQRYNSFPLLLSA